MQKPYFEGWYFKQQCAGQTIAFIPGYTRSGAFVQVITPERTYAFDMPPLEVQKGAKLEIRAGNCAFSGSGVQIDLPNIRGEISFGTLTKLHSDIMGPFQFFPMECRHGVISMRHSLCGSLNIEGKKINFDGGVGYIEKDSGCSFPKKYVWVQCNQFDGAEQDCSVMLSIANIPAMGLHFKGCICAIVYGEREYRLATYKNVKINEDSEDCIQITQGALRLEITMIKIETGQAKPQKGHILKAPVQGIMSGRVRECNNVAARFQLWERSEKVFDLTSRNVSMERFGQSRE